MVGVAILSTVIIMYLVTEAASWGSVKALKKQDDIGEMTGLTPGMNADRMD